MSAAIEKRSIMDMEPILADVRRIAHIVELVGVAMPHDTLDRQDTAEVLVFIGGLLAEKENELVEIWDEAR